MKIPKFISKLKGKRLKITKKKETLSANSPLYFNSPHLTSDEVLLLKSFDFVVVFYLFLKL